MTGTLHIVGLGPGGPEHRTPAATAAIAGADAVVGYGPYVDLCTDALGAGQDVVRGAMGEEAERADQALALAADGACVALVSSGDAGVHGMAARTLARAAALPEPERPAVEVVPGVTAATAAAALVGAPLSDDFAVISLSDHNMDWEQVRDRLLRVAGAGLALALYNPRARGRTEQFDEALALLCTARGGRTPVCLVHDAGRPGQAVERTTLGVLDPERVTMRTLVLVAGEGAREEGPWLVAHRGGARELAR